MSKVRPVVTENQYYAVLKYARKLAKNRVDVKYFGDGLNELLRLAELITDPLSQELIRKGEDVKLTANEIKIHIDTIEEIYPPGGLTKDTIGNYCLGILAGLKMMLGEYPSFIEMDMQDFYRLTFRKHIEEKAKW